MSVLNLHVGVDIETVPDRWTKPFWEAAAEHRLVAACCNDCGTFRHPPTAFCPVCRSQVIDWVELSGEAELYTYTIVRHPPSPQLAEAVPYVIGIVKPDGAPGIKMMTNVVGCEPDDVHIGMRLHVAWDEASDGLIVPRFAP